VRSLGEEGEGKKNMWKNLRRPYLHGPLRSANTEPGGAKNQGGTLRVGNRGKKLFTREENLNNDKKRGESAVRVGPERVRERKKGEKIDGKGASGQGFGWPIEMSGFDRKLGGVHIPKKSGIVKTSNSHRYKPPTENLELIGGVTNNQF